MDTPQAPVGAAADGGSPDGFDSLGLSPAVARAVAELGYETPTDVQRRCIPLLLAGRDLLGQAQTGTGKTAAFALPLLSRLDFDEASQEPTPPQVLVITPTRELALQVAEAFQRYAHHLPAFHVAPIYGGQSYSLQIRALKRSPQVVVGTPGRVMDHMRRGTLSLSGLRALVLDEADEMLDMGFADDIDWIFEHAPPERQVALFSATMPDTIRRVARQRLRDPVEQRISTTSATVDTIEQQHIIVTRFHKLDVLTRLLELEAADGMVVFVRTRHGAIELADKLKAHGFAADALHGDMEQQQRERTIDGLKQGRLDIVVATDVAARGLDVERVTHVVNYDIPTDPQAYVHRIGRTGRAGRSGRAILLVEPRERGLLRAIERTIGGNVPEMPPPSAAEISASRIDRFTSDLRGTLAGEDLDFFYRLVANLQKEQELDLMDIAAALAFQLQRERPLEVTEELRPPRRNDREGGRRPDRPPARRDERGRSDAGRRFEPRDTRGERDRRPRADEGGPAQGGDRRRPDQRSGPRERPADLDLTSYRIEVGHDHGVTPREIVGAIANEAGLEGRYIGRIDIGGDHSTVDLPSGMPKEIFQHLKGVYVRGQPLRISRVGAGPQGRPGGRDDAEIRRPSRPDQGTGDRSGPRRHADGDRPRRDDGGFRRKRRD